MFSRRALAPGFVASQFKQTFQEQNGSMHTVAQTVAFSKKVEGKFRVSDVADLVELLSRNPKAGEKFTSAGNLFRYTWCTELRRGAEYDVIYVFHSIRDPLLIVNIFKCGEAALLDKTLACLAGEIVQGGSE